MNKYTKNMIWFNLSRIITITTILILTIVVLSQCKTSQYVHEYDIYKYNKKNPYSNCYTFRNSNP